MIHIHTKPLLLQLSNKTPVKGFFHSFRLPVTWKKTLISSSPGAQAGEGTTHPNEEALQYSRQQPWQHQQVGLSHASCACQTSQFVFVSHHLCALVTPLSVSLSWLSRSSSYTRRLHSQSGNEFTSSTPSLLHRSVALLTTWLVFVGSPVCVHAIVFAEPIISEVNTNPWVWFLMVSLCFLWVLSL